MRSRSVFIAAWLLDRLRQLEAEGWTPREMEIASQLWACEPASLMLMDRAQRQGAKDPIRAHGGRQIDSNI